MELKVQKQATRYLVNKGTATKPDNLSLIPITHMVKGENSFKLPSDLHICAMPYMHTVHPATHTQISVKVSSHSCLLLGTYTKMSNMEKTGTAPVQGCHTRYNNRLGILHRC